MLDFELELGAAVDSVSGRLTVPGEWEGFAGTAFGGFVAGALVVAASSRTELPRPLSSFIRFHRPVPVGRAIELRIESERRGRTVETFVARIFDGERLLANSTVAFGVHAEAPLQSQAVEPMAPLVRPRPVWRFLEEIGIEPNPLMRRVGFRGEPPEAQSAADYSADWHLRSQWPGSASGALAVRAAVALMPIDSFVGPATIRANRRDINAPWPVVMPTLDLAAWFYAPEASPADADDDSPAGWLSTRTSVPVSHAGYAVGRTQVWSGATLVAEGMSQVALLPAPAVSA